MLKFPLDSAKVKFYGCLFATGMGKNARTELVSQYLYS